MEIVYVVLFILLTVVIFHSLKNSPMDFGRSSLLISVCVTLLSLIGLSKHSGDLYFLLFPYSVLIILLPLIFLAKLLGNNKRKLEKKENVFDKMPDVSRPVQDKFSSDNDMCDDEIAYDNDALVGDYLSGKKTIPQTNYPYRSSGEDDSDDDRLNR